jgi:16S rRNA (uracil1498-N3)-methyltransferase
MPLTELLGRNKEEVWTCCDMMTEPSLKAPRILLNQPLATGNTVALEERLVHYLANVMRLKFGEAVLAFNGADGEWLCRFEPAGKKAALLYPERQVRPQPKQGDIWFAFAPIKSERLDYLVQKAVEMGVSDALPVFTERTQGRQFNAGKALANMVEAAEQCGILAVPRLHDAQTFAEFVRSLPQDRVLVFCDEEAEHRNPVAAIHAVPRGAKLALIIGPVGGFSDSERQQLIDRANTVRISLGPRILRADTAAVAALALVQAVIGDW